MEKKNRKGPVLEYGDTLEVKNADGDWLILRKLYDDSDFVTAITLIDEAPVGDYRVRRADYTMRSGGPSGFFSTVYTRHSFGLEAKIGDERLVRWEVLPPTYRTREDAIAAGKYLTKYHRLGGVDCKVRILELA